VKTATLHRSDFVQQNAANRKTNTAQWTRQLRREIQTFQQKDGDLFFEAWEHFKELLLKCPHHNLSQDDQVQAFYKGLNDSNKVL
jgi:hypothetical protein